MSNTSDVELEELNYQKLQLYKTNRAISSDVLLTLLIGYILLIALGAIGNGLVCMAVYRKPNMRTPRNLFILNLAISDLTLCLITMPFTLIEIAYKYWTLGEIACKLVAGLEALSIFVSALTITAIAQDRYHVIINPTQDITKISRTCLTIILIWIFALFLSTPLFCFSKIHNIPVPLTLQKEIGASLYYCVEQWPIDKGRGWYSLFTIIVQYLLPTIIVFISYLTIYHKLKGRMSQKRTVIKLDERIKAEEKRTRRTNTLLISISLIFCISWLPLNIVNILSDFELLLLEDKSYRIVFAICHMIGMSSACINPLLYGWLNDNFQKEFKEIFSV